MFRLPLDGDMSGTVLVVTSGKGGVGKSTTALNLGVALGIDGHSVALVDADLGMANLGSMLDVESDPTLHDVLAGEADVASAVVTEGDSFGVVPGGRDLTKYAEADPARLPDVLATLAERYEFVVVDAGAGLGYADVVPIDAADEVILVTTPDDTAIGDTAKLLEFSGVIDARVRGVVLTRASEEEDGEAIAAEIGVDLLGVVPEDTTVPESAAAAVPLEQHAPDSPAAAAYRRLAGVVSGTATAEDPRSTGTPESAETATADESAKGDGPTDERSLPDEDDSSEEGGNQDEAPADTADRETEDVSMDGDGETGEVDATDEEESTVGDAPDTDTADADAADENGGGILSRLRGLF